MEYVLCAVFFGDEVCLILKNRPEWQKGLYNLPGGKIEECDKCNKGENSTIKSACTREFHEETGCFIYWCAWDYCGKIVNLKSKSEVYICIAEIFHKEMVSTKTDEPIAWFKINSLPDNRMTNIQEIIYRCLGRFDWQIEYDK